MVEQLDHSITRITIQLLELCILYIYPNARLGVLRLAIFIGEDDSIFELTITLASLLFGNSCLGGKPRNILNESSRLIPPVKQISAGMLPMWNLSSKLNRMDTFYM